MAIINEIIALIKPQFEKDASGHDFYHIERVLNMARFIQSKEGGDLEVIELAALLHDISDHKFNGGKLNEGGKVAAEILKDFNYPQHKIDQIKYIIDNVSYKGAKTSTEMKTLEGKIVQDADRLDAIGAIGIGRTFAYGGHKGQPMYDPEMQSTLHTSFEEYANSPSNTINHFYEKLLLLVERLNTNTAIEIGKIRHKVMQDFLEEFYKEWHFNQITNE